MPRRLAFCTAYQRERCMRSLTGSVMLSPCCCMASSDQRPGVVFLKAAGLVDVEADGVVADLVQEDGDGHRAAGARGFDEVDAAAVAVDDVPGDAGHALAPLADADAVAIEHEFDNRVVLGLHHGGLGVRGED